ncbi:MAG: hypothetical protein ACM3ZE_16520, partial [Myxococcales bacterium]
MNAGPSDQPLAVVAASLQRYVLEARRMVQDPEQSEPQETQTNGLPRASWAIWMRRAVLILVAIAVAATLWKIGRGYGDHQIELHWSPVIAATLILVATNLMQAMA